MKLIQIDYQSSLFAAFIKLNHKQSFEATEESQPLMDNNVLDVVKLH